MTGHVVGLHASPSGGVPKHPLDTLEVTPVGCTGDRQRNTKHHGGPQRAVCLLEVRVLESLQRQGHPIMPGSTGENILIDGLETPLDEFMRLQVGQTVLRITGDAPPCKTIKASFLNGSFQAMSHREYPGMTRWYAAVEVAGRIELNDPITVLSEDEPVGNL